jgi:hypothetical protein
MLDCICRDDDDDDYDAAVIVIDDIRSSPLAFTYN